MRVPYNWLLDYIEPGLTPDQLAERFTMSGIEVGAVEPFAPPLPGVVVGQVKTIEDHPGKSNLVLVEADVGDISLNIVCGAKNMQVGDKVPVAKPGSVLPGPRKIEEAIVHGAKSSGMLCSAHELGLGLGSAEEILILDSSEEIGKPVDEALGFNEQILHLELTPNRADCFSLLGVAYETAALTGKKIKFPDLSLPETGDPIEKAIKIAVPDQDLCSRYTARAALGVTISPSPLWMQLRLLKAGIRPISNVVDITNYVMWEFGQPLHAFDMQLLTEGEINVRRAREGEKLITLDGMERSLDSDILVIADKNKPVGLAGVMGGENTEITASTRDVLIEAAAFNAANIRRTARRFNLPSEASQRFEKGINPEAVLWSQDRAAQLINKMGGGQIMRGVFDVSAALPEPSRIKVRPARINQILGLEIPEKEIEAILLRLGFDLQHDNGQTLLVTVPLRRADVTIEEDIIEEVARLHGYDKIPTTLPQGKLVENSESAADRLQRFTRDILTSGGFYECITYSFINPAGLVKLRLPEDSWQMKTIPVQNPFSEEQAAMRTTLLPGILKAVQHNLSFRELNQSLFEIGSIYKAEHLPLEELPAEKVKLMMAVTGLSPEPNWLTPAREADYYTIKGILSLLFSRFQISGVEYSPEKLPFTHPTRSAIITIDGEELGFLGQLHPEIAEAWEIDQAVTVCEIDMELLGRKANLVPRVAPLPRYPSAKRDIAIVVPRDIPARQLKQAIEEAGGELVSAVSLFDLYEGKQIPEGKRSLAYSITFRRDEKTLTEAEINAAQKKIETALFSLGAELRS